MKMTSQQYYEKAQALRLGCYERKWEPVAWQFDHDTYRQLCSVDPIWIDSVTEKMTWMDLPIENIFINKMDHGLVMDTVIRSEPFCFALICRSRLTNRMYYLDDPETEAVYTSDGPTPTLTVKVT